VSGKLQQQLCWGVLIWECKALSYLLIEVPRLQTIHTEQQSSLGPDYKAFVAGIESHYHTIAAVGMMN
jgi:hypothetical protein